jgi:hypothetical protein
MEGLVTRRCEFGILHQRIEEELRRSFQQRVDLNKIALVGAE